MTELQNRFESYIRYYVKCLAKEEDEFFISICDIDEDFLQEFPTDKFENYRVVVVNKNDYSEAVRLRNLPSVTRIILLSGEGIKQIDSLKDFNEYSVISEEKELVRKCLQSAFGTTIEQAMWNFLEVILDECDISLLELFNYLESSLTKGGLSVQKLNRNLPMLGIWKSREKKLLGKGEIHRMIKASRYQVIENRLTRAIMDNNFREKQIRIITDALAKGDINKILENFYFDEVDTFLKNNIRRTVRAIEDMTINEPDYCNSYEYKLIEGVRESIDAIEKEWISRKDEGEIDWVGNWYGIFDTEIILEESRLQFDDIAREISNMNLSEDKIIEFQSGFTFFCDSYRETLKHMEGCTPFCLKSFCEMTKEYTQKYFDLLNYILSDNKVRCAVTGSKVIEQLQTFGCERTEGVIRMPYFHPLSALYYQELQKMYQAVLYRTVPDAVTRNQIQAAVIKKLGMQFPAEFIVFAGQKFALDYSTVWQSPMMEFRNVELGAVYSMIDFRIVNRQIMEYISSHPFMTEITIALVDIGDLSGIQQLICKIRLAAKGEKCNIGRIDFLILSLREEELKRKLSQIWDAVGSDELVRFRFARNEYRGADGYDLKRIVKESDMTIIADNAELYHEPRMIPYNVNTNVIQKRLEQLDLEQQLNGYYKTGKTDMHVVWDTLQHITENRENGYWEWISREVNNGVIALINELISKYKDKNIVILSSNPSILSEIYATRYIKAYRKKYNGKDITLICFEADSSMEQLPEDGKAEIEYSLVDFYDNMLELDRFEELFGEDIQDIKINLYEKKGTFCCKYTVYGNLGEAATWEDEIKDFICWQQAEFLTDSNILSRYFQEICLTYWNGKTKNLPSVLLAERLSKNAPDSIFQEKGDEPRKEYILPEETDCMESFKVHEMIRFVSEKAVLDERTVSQFGEHFEIEKLKSVLRCDSMHTLLTGKQRDMLSNIYKRLRRV